MTQPTHTDLQRDFGRMEGRMDSLDKVMTSGFSRVESSLAKIEVRLDAIDTRESERKGAGKVIVAVASAAGAIASIIVSIVVPFLIDVFTGR